MICCLIDGGAQIRIGCLFGATHGGRGRGGALYIFENGSLFIPPPPSVLVKRNLESFQGVVDGSVVW